MRLYLDIDTGQVSYTLGGPVVTTFVIYLRDKLPVELVYVQAGEIVTDEIVDGGTNILQRIGLKSVPSGALLAGASSYTVETAGSGESAFDYSAALLSLNTTELIEYFAANVAPGARDATMLFEVETSAIDFTSRVTRLQINVTVRRDVLQPTDEDPISADEAAGRAETAAANADLAAAAAAFNASAAAASALAASQSAEAADGLGGLTWLSTGGRTSAEQAVSDLGLVTPAQLGQVGISLAAGNAVTIAEYGDSTTVGYLSGGSTANPTPTATLQAALRAFYHNTAATVTNHGVSGNQTTNVLRTWEAVMASETASVIVINYGINDMQGANPTGVTDPAITPAQYATNLRRMVTIARAAGKVVVLNTPNAILPGYGALGTKTKSEGVAQFAAAMRTVARELGVALIDNHEFSLRYLRGPVSAVAALPDGLHPSQDLYDALARNRAAAFVAAAVVERSAGIVPAAAPCFFQSGGTNIFSAAGSRAGIGRIANRITAAVLVMESGLDLYIATPIWSSGASSVALKINGSTVATLSLADSNLTGSSFAVDHEVLVARNVAPGLHYVELVAASGDAGAYYLRAYPSRNLFAVSHGETAAPSYSIAVPAIGHAVITGGGAGQNHLLTDIPMSCSIAPVTVSFTGTLAKNTGVVLLGRRGSAGGTPSGIRGGIAAFLDGSTGYLTLSEGTAASYTNLVAVGAVDLSGASHDYRFVIGTDGVVTCYVDGASIGTYTMTRSYRGGVLGFYASGAASATFRDVSIAQ